MKYGTALLVTLSAAFLAACSAVASGEENEYSASSYEAHNNGNHDANSSAVENHRSSSSVADSSGDTTGTSLGDLVKLIDIPAITFSRGSTSFKIAAYSISKTEVTQGMYKEVMGTLPKDNTQGDDYPVFNVSWYDAARFCNAISKRVGFDTAYVYSSVSGDGILDNLSINYKVASIRLPLELEWEVAARAGTSSTYYWGKDEASKYAYYAQSKGPTAVASYKPNAYGLYDVSGNVAEWVSDWYDAFPSTSQENYTGPSSGKYKVVRGGGWSDKAPTLASSEREKKEPQYASQTVGFRVVYSEGF